MQDAHLTGVSRKHPGMGVGELAEIEQVSRPVDERPRQRLEAAGLLEARAGPGRSGRKALHQVRDTRAHWLENG